jgi:selenocysteine lyase/cysteine desulfurase
MLNRADERFFAALRRREFSRLDSLGLAYLDATGSALYGESQLRAQHELLRDGCFGNPHSEHAPSRRSTETIERARESLLGFLGADPATHAVVFTANATAAIKLVAESYPFAPGSRCLLAADNHNSVNGLGEYARRAGAEVAYLPLDGTLRLDDPDDVLGKAAGRGVLAFPAQSNFSGVRHPLALVARAKERGLDVLLDIASHAASHPVSLADCPADFAVLSFYKLFGLPTGLGALVARRDALARLRRPWFAGGTVLYASVDPPGHRLRPDAAGFEDGTPDFLAIATLAAGFALLEEVGMVRIERRVASLTALLLEGLSALRRPSGGPLVRIYGPTTLAGRGGTVTFNVLGRDGRAVPYWTVEERAREAGVAVRGGCFCNPGAAQAALGLDGEASARCFERLGDDFTPERFAACLEQPVGAIRISPGMANDRQDVERALELVASFAERSAATNPSASSGVSTQRSSSRSTSTALRKSLA